ncbi:MAG: cation:proton antiporter [Nocardioidaceae bacterium]|nr:cation:proton antiporter [Nocardioidaceae bacterium]
MTSNLAFLLVGVSMLLAVVLPYVLRRAWLSSPVVLLGVGAVIGLLPVSDGFAPEVVDDRAIIEHVTEITVIVALMGVGLALDRPLHLFKPSTWRRWSPTWRMLLIAMPLSIAAVAFLGWWAVGLAPASALLLGAALAPTDPVLASDVQVEGPSSAEDPSETDETDEVRFALTSEAGLNDGLAFPFVHAAILLATVGGVGEWGLEFVAWDLVGKTVVAIVLGVAVGWLLGRIAFRSRAPSLRTSENSEPLLAVAAVLLSYGVAQVAGGYGFVAVFVCALTIRSSEPSHEYHVLMHQVVQRLERILTLVVLLLLGVALTHGLLEAMTWGSVLLAVLLVLVVRPLSGVVALMVRTRRYSDRDDDPHLGPRERLVTAFFGVRGIGSLYYLAYATGHAEFEDAPLIWSTLALAVVLSVVVHGITATPVMAWLDRARDRTPAA